MPLSTAALERAGIHVSIEELARLMNIAIEQAIPPYKAVDAWRALPPAELETCCRVNARPAKWKPV